MKRFFALATIVGVAMTMVSCGVYQYSETIDYRESSATELPFEAPYILTTPLVADLTVMSEKPVTIVVKDMFKDTEITRELIAGMPDLKKIAIVEAVKELNTNKAKYGLTDDVNVLVGTLVNVETTYRPENGSAGRLEITVIGYPARYTDFRKGTEEDLKLIRDARISHPASNAPADVTNVRSTTLKENVRLF